MSNRLRLCSSDHLSCGGNRLGTRLSLSSARGLLGSLLRLLLSSTLSLGLSLGLLSSLLGHVLHSLLRSLLGRLLGSLLTCLLRGLFRLSRGSTSGFLLSHRGRGNCRGSSGRSRADRHRGLSLLYCSSGLSGGGFDVSRSVGRGLLNSSNQSLNHRSCGLCRSGSSLLRGVGRSID